MSLWRHKASGKTYRIVCFAVEEKTLIPVVVYHHDESERQVWTRPASEFFDGRFEQLTVTGKPFGAK